MITNKPLVPLVIRHGPPTLSFPSSSSISVSHLEGSHFDRRHTEPQPRDLTEATKTLKALEGDNAKLKDFIRQQAIECDDLRRGINASDDYLVSNLETTKRQLESVVQEKNVMALNLNVAMHRFEAERQGLQQEISILRNNNSNLTLSTRLKPGSNYEMTGMWSSNVKEDSPVQVEKMKREIERLSGIAGETSESGKRVIQLRGELNSREGSYQELSRRLEITLHDKQKIHQELLQIESKYKDYEKSSWKLTDLESKYRRQEDEMDQLKATQRQRVLETQELTAQKKRAEHELEAIRVSTKTTIELLQTKLSEVGKVANQWSQMQISLQGHLRQKEYLVEENSRLKQNFRASTTNIQRINSQLNDVKRKILELNQQNQQLKARLHNLSDTNIKLAETESRVLLLSHELEKINSVLDARNNEMNCLIVELNESRNKNQVWLHENEQCKRRIQEFGESHRKAHQMENRVTLLSEQIERLNGMLEQKQKDSLGLIRKINDYEGLNHTVTQLQQKINQRFNQNLVLTTDIKTAHESVLASTNQLGKAKADNEELKRTVSRLEEETHKLGEYEEKINLLTSELERISHIVERKDSENCKYLVEVNKAKEMLNKSMAETEQYKRRVVEVSESTRRLSDYESRIFILTQDVDRLTESLELKNNQYSDAFDEARELKSRNQQLNNENEMLKRRLMETSQLIRKNSEFQQKISLLSEEIERLNNLMNKRSHDFMKNETLVSQLKLKNNQISQDNEQLKRKLTQLAEANRRIGEYELKNRELFSEVEMLKVELKEQGYNASRAENEHSNSQSRLMRLVQENQDLKLRLMEIRSLDERIVEYQQRIVLLTKEINRLNGVIENKNLVVEKEIHDKNQLLERLNSLNAKADSQEARLNQNSKTQGRINDYEQRMRILSDQINRLNTVVDRKIQLNYKSESELSQFKARMNGLNSENQHLKRKVNEVTTELEELKYQFVSRSGEVGGEVERCEAMIQERNEEIGRNIRLIEQMKEEIVYYSQENEQLARGIQESTNREAMNTSPEEGDKVLIMSQQIHRLYAMIEQKNTELRTTHSQMSQLRSMCSRLEQESSHLQSQREIRTPNIHPEAQVGFNYQTIHEEFHFSQSSLHSSQQRVTQLEQEVQHFHRILSEQHSFIKHLQNLNQELETRMSQSEPPIASEYANPPSLSNEVLVHEIERLNGVLFQKNEEIHSLRGNEGQ